MGLRNHLFPFGVLSYDERRFLEGRLGLSAFVGKSFSHLPLDLFGGQWWWSELGIVFPFDVLLASVCAVERGVGVDPRDESNELRASDIRFAWRLANPFDQSALIRPECQRRVDRNMSTTKAVGMQIADQPLVRQIFVRTIKPFS